MPKMTADEQLMQCSEFLTHLGELMYDMSIAVRDGNDEEALGRLVESLPTKKDITKNLVLLGKLLEGQPWRKHGRAHRDS